MDFHDSIFGWACASGLEWEIRQGAFDTTDAVDTVGVWQTRVPCMNPARPQLGPVACGIQSPIAASAGGMQLAAAPCHLNMRESTDARDVCRFSIPCFWGTEEGICLMD